MAFTAGFSVNVGDPTKASDVDVLAANDDYLKNAIDTFIANDANNRVLTATGSGTANAENNLTFDGSTLTVTGTVSATTFNGNVTGNLSGNVTGNLSGNVTGDLSGNVTGNVTGNLTGDVTGNISGNVTGGTISGTTGTFSGDVAVGTDKLFVDVSASAVGISTSSPLMPLQLNNFGGFDGNSNQFILRNNLYYDPIDTRGESIKAGYATELELNNVDGSIVFRTSSSAATGANEALSTIERARITNAGLLGLGTSSPSTLIHAKSSSGIGKIRLEDDAGRAIELQTPSSGVDNGRIGTITNHDFEINAGNNNGTNFITFHTDGSEKVRISNAGNLGIGQSSPSGRLHVEGGGIYHIGSSLKYIASSSVQSISSTNNAGAELTTDAYLWINRSAAPCLFLNRTTTTGTIAVFHSDVTSVGTISVTASATAYNTSSDYRLKENLAPITGAVDRVNALQPRRFNFIAEPHKIVDGFVAHEVSAIVPEAITGEKDAVDADGNPEYQGIDQSKLVPLLTAAIQELTARIEALEAA